MPPSNECDIRYIAYYENEHILHLRSTAPHQALVNAVVVKSLFKGYDINNSGSVPLEDFMRGLNQLDQTIVQKEGLALAKVNNQPP